MVSHPKGLFYFQQLKLKIMNTPDINTIAFQYLLRTGSKKDNNSEDATIGALQYNPEHDMKSQKSVLFHMYELEQEEFFI